MAITIEPRDYKSTGTKFSHDYNIMLRDHPEAFDCIIFPAKDSTSDEQIAIDAPVVGMLDRNERLQEYAAPVKARAMIVPDDSMLFNAVESGEYENFHSMPESISLLLSVPFVRTYSIIQWKEFLRLDGSDVTEKTVYVAATRNLGKTLGSGVVHICFPLPNEGDIPPNV